MGLIIDLDQTLIDPGIAKEARKTKRWEEVYDLIPKMKPNKKIVEFVKKAVLEKSFEIAIITSGPPLYCEKVLKRLHIKDVIAVSSPDEEHQCSSLDLYQLAVSQMMTEKNKKILAIGNKKTDIEAACKTGILSGFLCNGTMSEEELAMQPYVMFKSSLDVVSYLNAFHNRKISLRRRIANIYYLYSYYPVSGTHDHVSEEIFNEVKRNNDSRYYSSKFYHAIKNTFKKINPGECGIFVAPSSIPEFWNEKMVHAVAKELVENDGYVDCSKHILRCLEHEKQAFGGERSVYSHCSTMKIQYDIPKEVKYAIIIDDITTTGSILEACTQLLNKKGIDQKNIYAAALAGTEHVLWEKFRQW